MKKVHKCYDETEIHYRLPNVIELFDLQDKAGWGEDKYSGFGKIARVLENAEPFIIKVKPTKGKKDFKACIEDRNMADDLSIVALSLVRDKVSDEEKKLLRVVGQNIGFDYPVFDTLDADESSRVFDTIRLYSSINKANALGISLDGSKLPYMAIERMYVMHSAMEDVQKQRAKRKK